MGPFWETFTTQAGQMGRRVMSFPSVVNASDHAPIAIIVTGSAFSNAASEERSAPSPKRAESVVNYRDG